MKQSPLFIMPRTSRDWSTAEGLWILTAGWASAAKKIYGDSIVLTRDKIGGSEDALQYPFQVEGKPQNKSSLLKYIPSYFKTLRSDLKVWSNSKKWNIVKKTEGINIPFVWEQHDLFPGPGYSISRRLKVPFILFVHAPVVWETRKWGVNRHFYGGALESLIEERSLKRADLVVCVSDMVAERLISMGIKKEKILITPTGVDPDVFDSVNESYRNNLCIGDNLVIGWIGSFRSFHGLDILLKAFKTIKNKYSKVSLLLVGDGPLRKEMEQLAIELGIASSTLFVGKKTFLEIPSFINLFDIAVVSSNSADNFHYSPQKLREYLIAGVATVAPSSGEIPTAFEDGQHVLLYKTGDPIEMEQRILTLLKDGSLRKELGVAGKEHVLNNYTWEIQLKNALKKVGVL